MNVNIPLKNNADYIILGVDIGSTTAKIVVMKDNALIYHAYERHYSESKVKSILFRTRKKLKAYLEQEGIVL